MESTSTVVEKLVALMLDPEAEVEVAATDEVKATLVAPEPEADVEAAGALQVLGIVLPSEAGPSTSCSAASLLPSEAGPSTSRALVPLSVPDAEEHEEHDEDWIAPGVDLEKIQLIANHLATI